MPLYRVFEVHIRNTATRVANPFSDVLLETNFTAPSGKLTPFWGFFNGNFTFVQVYRKIHINPVFSFHTLIRLPAFFMSKLSAFYAVRNWGVALCLPFLG